MSYSDVLRLRSLTKVKKGKPLYKDIVRDGLVLYLDGKDFSNSPPTATWLDKSGLGNNATPSGMAYTTASGSDGVGGVVFDGVDDKCIVPFNNILSFVDNDFTIECFFKTSSSAANFITQNNYVTANCFELFMNASKIIFGFNGNYTSIVSTNALNDNFKHCISICRKNNNALIYVDGILDKLIVDIFNSVSFTNTNSFSIGSRVSGSTSVLNGKMYSIKIYNQALTDTEILKNYNASK